MTDQVIEVITSSQELEVTTPTPVTVQTVIGTTGVVETYLVAQSVEINTVSAVAVEVPTITQELNVNPPAVVDVEVATGLTGRTPKLYSGTAPPSEAVGLEGDLYLVSSGPTIGDLYGKASDGWGTPDGNLRGGIASVNGISGTNIIIGANNITTGVLPIAQVPTGTTGTTVALGNHLHTGVYQPAGSYENAIAAGTTAQYWRGDKSWQTLDKTAVGLGSVVNSDTTNASNISTGTLAIGRIPTGTTGTTVAPGNHNHDATYVALTGSQTIAGTKTFTNIIEANAGADGLRILPGSQDHAYLALHARGSSPGTRSALIGYNAVASNVLTIANQISTGNVVISVTGAGQIQLNAPVVAASTQFTTATLKVGTSTTAGYVLTADASGNATWQQTANIIVPGTTAQYYRGDLTWQTLNATAVGLENVANAAQVELTGNQTIAGTKTFSSEIVGPSTGNVLKVGDDARIADVNLANAIGVIGVQDPTKGGIVLGPNAAGFRLMSSGATNAAGTITASGGLTITANVTVSGTITGNGSGLTALPAGSLTGTIAIARLPVGTTGTDVAAGNHAHTGVYEPVITAGTTAQYWRGDKSWQTLNAAAVGLGNVANVVQVDLTSGQTITGAKVMNNASNTFTGNGTALTALNATQLTTGTVPQARIVPNTQRFIFTTGAEARPTGTTYVEWIGPVTPANASNDDTWVDTSSPTIEDPVVGMPIGTIQDYGGTGAPTNWLTLNGAAISRTTYATLFALIGTTYGVGNGSTTFNLPNSTLASSSGVTEILVDTFTFSGSGAFATSTPGASDGVLLTLPVSGDITVATSATGFNAANTGITIEVYVDTVLSGTMTIPATHATSERLTLPTAMFKVTGLSSGNHRIAFKQTQGTSNSGDTYNIMVNLTKTTPVFTRIIKVL
jgi:microcystin-dependent protein